MNGYKIPPYTWDESAEPTTPDLKGMRTGMLTVVRRHGLSSWTCRCDCGKERVVRNHEILKGVAKTCGCRGKKTIILYDPDTRGGFSPGTMISCEQVEGMLRMGTFTPLTEIETKSRILLHYLPGKYRIFGKPGKMQKMVKI
jgi:hypothetical protein